jgi:membrane protease YdiL (CAAX protease family)
MAQDEPNSSPTWSSNRAWACSLVLIALAFGLNEWYWIIARYNIAAGRWLVSATGETAQALVQGASWLAFAFYFAPRRSLRTFLFDMGLTSKPTVSGWVATLASIGISVAVRYGHLRHWIPPTHHYRAYAHGGQFIWLVLFIQLVAIVPIYEETVMRGFLYRAFRSSYGQVLSTLLVLSVEIYFHWGLVSRSLYLFAWWGALQILLFQLRERSGNTWNCILSHAAYNAMQFLQ